ncbi:MAG: putative transcriptional regulator, MerR family [Bacillota bacterium]|jgi:DNA-binding transcriptional MerR regulator|nr:putative transcriptional regulator, MerR family [Bacillota bacterium]
MKDNFLIGELSKIFHVSTDTLRHYDKIGLLNPSYDDSNRYRFYSVRDFFKLSRILFFKDLDIPLQDIKNYMNNKNTINLVTILKNKEKAIDIKINKLINLQKKITAKLDLLGSIKQELNVVKIKHMPQRIGILLNVNDSNNEYELKQSIKKNQEYFKLSSMLIEGQLYTSLEKDDMINGIFYKFKYFIEIISTEDIVTGHMTIFPEREYACVVFKGCYNDTQKHYKILVQWINENGYEILGDSIKKNIVDYDFSDSENEYVSEIQIPIRKLSIK